MRWNSFVSARDRDRHRRVPRPIRASARELRPRRRTLAERPGLLLSFIRDELDRAAASDGDTADRERQETLSEAQAKLATAMPAERERFERAIAFATRAYPIREDNIFVVDGLPSGLIRRAAIDIGRRLTKRGDLATPEDAVFPRTRSCAPRSPANEPIGVVVSGGGKPNAWVLAHPGPASYGNAGRASRPSPRASLRHWRRHMDDGRGVHTATPKRPTTITRSAAWRDRPVATPDGHGRARGIAVRTAAPR